MLNSLLQGAQTPPWAPPLFVVALGMAPPHHIQLEHKKSLNGPNHNSIFIL